MATELLEQQMTFRSDGNISNISAKALRNVNKKWCPKCKQILEFSSFSKVWGTPWKYCRNCVNTNPKMIQYKKESSKKWRQQNPLAHMAIKRRYELSDNGRYADAKRRAIKSGWDWNISIEQYLELIKKPCSYCKMSLHNHGIGLDRINNLDCYNIDNVTPCCPMCNVVRGDRFSIQEMINIIGPAIQLVKKGRI